MMHKNFVFALALCMITSFSPVIEAQSAPPSPNTKDQISLPEIALPELVNPPTVKLPPEITTPSDFDTDMPNQATAPITAFEESQNTISRTIKVGIGFAEAIKRGDRLRARFMMGLPFLAETKIIDSLTDLDRIFGPKLAPDRQPIIPDDIANNILVGVMSFRTVEFRAIPFLAQQAASMAEIPVENYDFVVALTYSDNGHYETMLVLVRRLPDDRLEVAGYINS